MHGCGSRIDSSGCALACESVVDVREDGLLSRLHPLLRTKPMNLRSVA